MIPIPVCSFFLKIYIWGFHESFKGKVVHLEARYNKSLEYVRRLVTENKDLRMLMNKYIKVSKGGLKNSMFQEPQERGDTSEKVYGILNKVIHIHINIIININVNININIFNKVINTSEATHLSDSRKYTRMQTKLQAIEERVLNISKAHAVKVQSIIVSSSSIFWQECSPIQDSSELDSTLRKDCESRLSKLEAHVQVVM